MNIHPDGVQLTCVCWSTQHTRLLTEVPGHAFAPVLKVLPGELVAPQCRSERGPDRQRRLAGGPPEDVVGSGAAMAAVTVAEILLPGVSPPGRDPPFPPDSRLFASLHMNTLA